MVLTFEKIMQEIEKGIFHPVYFLMGEEPYFIDKITEAIAEKALPPDQKSFNFITLYGKDVSVREVINTAKRYPMMADRMVVIVKEAQDLRKIEDLHYYLQKPQPTTVLVINYKYKILDKRRALYTRLKQSDYAVVFESKKLYENKIPSWIYNYLKNKGLSIDAVASQLLVESLGTDLSRIANELDKLAVLLPQGRKITPADIEQNVGISKDFNNFELQRALGEKNYNKVMQIVDYFADNQKNNPLTLTISSLYFFFTKIMKLHFAPKKDKNSLATLLGVHPYFVQEYYTAANNYPPKKIVSIIKILREYDLRAKGVDNASTPAGELLKEMIFKIMYA